MSETEPVIVAAVCDGCRNHPASPKRAGEKCKNDVSDTPKWHEPCGGTFQPAVSLAAWREMREQRDALAIQNEELQAAKDRLIDSRNGVMDVRDRLRNERDAALAQLAEKEERFNG